MTPTFLVSIDPSFSNTGIAIFHAGRLVGWNSKGAVPLAKAEKHRPDSPTAYRCEEIHAWIIGKVHDTMRDLCAGKTFPYTALIETAQDNVFLPKTFAKNRRNGGIDVAKQSMLVGFLISRYSQYSAPLYEISATEWSIRKPTGGVGKPRRCMEAAMLAGCKPTDINDGEADAILMGLWWLDDQHKKRVIGGAK